MSKCLPETGIKIDNGGKQMETGGKGKPKILVVGSFVMDQIATTNVLPKQGQSVLGKTFRKAPGGKGANQAVQAARLGSDVTLIGKIGDDSNGSEMLAVCQAAGINTDYVICEKGASSGCAIILLEELPDGSTQNRILVIPGTNMSISLSELQGVKDIIADFDMVMLQLEIPMEINLHIAKIAAEHNIPIMLNPAPFTNIPDELYSYISYISPNETELEDLTGIHIEHRNEFCDLEAAQRAATILHDRGIKNVLITLGSAGAVLLNENGFFICPGVSSVKAVDPTAAGDSFIAAFCTAICCGTDVYGALNFANHTAAITVSRIGAMPSLPTYEEVTRGKDGDSLPKLF